MAPLPFGFSYSFRVFSRRRVRRPVVGSSRGPDCIADAPSRRARRAKGHLAPTVHTRRPSLSTALCARRDRTGSRPYHDALSRRGCARRSHTHAYSVIHHNNGATVVQSRWRCGARTVIIRAVPSTSRQSLLTPVCPSTPALPLRADTDGGRARSPDVTSGGRPAARRACGAPRRACPWRRACPAGRR